MSIKSHRNKKKASIYFSDAMNQIDESIDYNEYSEINSSDYFKETLYNAEEEVDKMMASPLMNDYKKFKTKKITMNLLKKNKDYILKKIKWLNEKNKNLKNIEINKKKINLNSMMKRLKKINRKNTLKNLEEIEESKKELNIKTNTNVIFPKINLSQTINNNKNKIKEEDLRTITTERKGINEDKNILLTEGNISKSLSINKKINNERNDNNQLFYFTQKRSCDSNIFDNRNKLNYSSNKQILDNMYLDCMKGLKSLEIYEKNESQKLINAKSYKIKRSKDIVNKCKDKIMQKFLVENINELNKHKYNKEEKIMKDYIKLKLKRDPLVKLSEKFAYFNRKPLLTLFNCDNKEEKIIMSPLAKLKIKDNDIMMKLENDNRNKNLLMKRLDENQTKYIKEGYFIMNKDKDQEKNKDIKKIKLKKLKINTNYNYEYDNEFFNKIKRIEPYENSLNIYN